MKYKKITSLVLSLALIMSILHTGSFQRALAVSISEFKDYAGYGSKISNSLSKVVWQGDQVHAYNDLANKSGDSFLWGYGSYIEGLGARVKNNPLDGNAVAEYKKALYNVLQYEATNLYSKYGIEKSDYLAMNCLPNNTNSEVFYDDDVWIQKEFLNAYNIFGEPEYLDIARRLMNYIYRGWDDVFGGGIYWKDTGYGGTSGKNTCINAPAAMASCQMYLATGDQSYLDWAVRIYAWTKDKFLDPADKLLWDNVDIDSKTGNESIDKAKYTYNAGCFISAAALLYQITGEQVYLNDAKATSASAFTKWLSKKNITSLGGESGYVWSSNHTWFNSSLVEGFLYLRSVDANETYVNACLSSLAVACLAKPDSAEGWISDNWQGASSISIANVSMLQQSATVRTLFMLADYQKGHTDLSAVISGISAYVPGSNDYKNAVIRAIKAYYTASFSERILVSNKSVLFAAMKTVLGTAGTAQVQEIIDSISNFYVVTYKTEQELLALQSSYNALSPLQKEFIINQDVLGVFLEYQQEIFDAFDVTVNGWASGKNTPWLDAASEDEKAATRATVTDELFYQYRVNYYRMGVTSGSRNLESYGDIIGIQIDNQPNDNVYNPWGHTNRLWSYVTVPFTGMSFSITGYFGNGYQLPIGNAFTYNGNVYQTYWNTVRYYAETPLVAGGSVDMKTYDFRPGYDGTNQMDANTFRYSYARFGEVHKWQNKTVGIATGNVQSFNNTIFYQKFEGPNGYAYIINTAQRIGAVSAVETTAASYEAVLRKNCAFVLSGSLADAFLSLAVSGNERLAITGAPLAEQSGDSMIFENGVLTPFGFEPNGSTTAALLAANEAIRAIPAIDAITLEDEQIIANARVKYNALGEEWKQYVTDYSRLLLSEERIADLKQEIVDRSSAESVDLHILALSNGGFSLTSRMELQSIWTEYNSLNDRAKSFVGRLPLLESCEEAVDILFADIDAINAGITSLGEITYRDGTAIRELLKKYERLSQEEKSYIENYDALPDAQSALQGIYDAFSVTVTGWQTSSKTPWLSNADDSAKNKTRAAIADEIKYQYVMNSYNVGVTAGDSRSLGNYSDMLGLQTESRPNDNVGNPWGSSGRYWAMVVAPFSGMSFSITGYFSRYFKYQLPIGNSFEFGGVVYQQYWDNYYSHTDTPVIADGTTVVSETKAFPGFDGASDITANTFRYAYAKYAQDNKWSQKTLGIPVSYAVWQDGIIYQRFDGPDGISYLVNTDERVLTSNTGDEGLMSLYSAYVITGNMALVLESLGENPFAATGKPVSALSDKLMEFENGILTGSSFYSGSANEEDILNSMMLSISEGMVSESSGQGRYDITWNAKITTSIFEEASVSLINQTGIKLLSYGVYYGTGEEAVGSFMNGNSEADARQLVFDRIENHPGSTEIDIHNMFGFRLKNVPEGKERCAVFYLDYEYDGQKYLLFSSASTVTVYVE